MKPIELVSNVAAGGSSTDTVFPPQLSGLWRRKISYQCKYEDPKTRFGELIYQKACHDVSGCYDAIIGLFSEIIDFTALLSVHARNNVTQELQEVVAKILVSLIAIFDHSAKAIRDGRVKKYLKAIVLGQDTNVQSELTNLRRLPRARRGWLER